MTRDCTGTPAHALTLLTGRRLHKVNLTGFLNFLLRGCVTRGRLYREERERERERESSRTVRWAG